MKNIILSLATVFSLSAFACGHHEMSADEHAKMAEAHQKAAQCLKDGKAHDECTQDLRALHEAKEKDGEGCAHHKKGKKGKK